MDILMKVEDLSYSINHKSILNHVSIVIPKGKCIGIVGPSGCGKSTLSLFLSLLELPQSGQIYYKDELVHKKMIKKIRKDIQMIFQNPFDVISPRMKIKKYLLEPYINFKIMNRNEAYNHIVQYLKQVGMDESCLDKYPHQLSGGQLQRIVMALAFSLQPELLICDEITSSIDVKIQEEIIELLISLKKDTTLVFISHDLKLVDRICDDIIYMADGSIVDSNHPTIQELKNSFLDVV